jgi:two-component sensor histidine kinase
MTDIRQLVRSLPARSPAFGWQFVIAIGSVVAGAALHLALETGLAGVPFITFFPAVLIASIWGGPRAGAMTLALGAIVASYFWIEPYRTADVTKLGASTVLVFLVMGTIIIVGAYLLQTSVAMARESEARANLIAREMQHRIGNKLAIVQSIARLSARHATSLEDFEERFQARLAALSESQSVARPVPDLPTDLETLLRAVMRPFDEERIRIFGPAAGVQERDRPMLALLVHELGTNALKHGALSVPSGLVSITWTSGPEVRLEWVESGGPPVSPPSRRGFGQQIARSAFPPDRGEVAVEYHPAGLRCTVTMRAEPERDARALAPDRAAGSSPAHAG